METKSLQALRAGVSALVLSLAALWGCSAGDVPAVSGSTLSSSDAGVQFGTNDRPSGSSSTVANGGPSDPTVRAALKVVFTSNIDGEIEPCG